jgi:sulfopyruvate decarboxylase subunit beta
VPRPEEELIETLKSQGVDFTASLPCEKFKTLLAMLPASFPHLPLTREEEGVGICAGAALAGKRPALFVQSSGVGNMINALLSLTQFYELPLAVFVSRRGVYQEKIAAQHPMGQRLPEILTGAGIGWTEVNDGEDLGNVNVRLASLYPEGRVHAFLLSPKVWEGSECKEMSPELEVRSAECGILFAKRQEAMKPALTRYEIVKVISPYLDRKVVVSNLGWPSKELYELKHQPSNFYMLGSMGMATPIGLGIALSTARDVVVIDGDGSILMNPGTLATAASCRPTNLSIVAIDNGAYGSTGNQPTLAGSCVDLEMVARGFGFRNTVKVATGEGIVEAVGRPREGLTFIHALAVPGNKDVPNIPVHHLEIKKQVMGFLRKQLPDRG